jgi:hypothetical protein
MSQICPAIFTWVSEPSPATLLSIAAAWENKRPRGLIARRASNHERRRAIRRGLLAGKGTRPSHWDKHFVANRFPARRVHPRSAPELHRLRCELRHRLGNNVALNWIMLRGKGQDRPGGRDGTGRYAPLLLNIFRRIPEQGPPSGGPERPKTRVRPGSVSGPHGLTFPRAQTAPEFPGQVFDPPSQVAHRPKPRLFSVSRKVSARS